MSEGNHFPKPNFKEKLEIVERKIRYHRDILNRERAILSDLEKQRNVLVLQLSKKETQDNNFYSDSYSDSL